MSDGRVTCERVSQNLYILGARWEGLKRLCDRLGQLSGGDYRLSVTDVTTLFLSFANCTVGLFFPYV